MCCVVSCNSTLLARSHERAEKPKSSRAAFSCAACFRPYISVPALGLDDCEGCTHLPSLPHNCSTVQATRDCVGYKSKPSYDGHDTCFIIKAARWQLFSKCQAKTSPTLLDARDVWSTAPSPVPVHGHGAVLCKC